MFPLTAMVGCRDVVDGIACALCSGNIRTVLIRGPPGTGKTVAVRGAAAVSGKIAVELPLNATPEQVFGTVDIDQAVSCGRRVVTDSVMRRADGNLLIADNVNLLPRSLRHGVLDAVITGRVRSEIDGASVDESCDTILLATMDPREADLDPHELDRFDICIETRTADDPVDRKMILRRSIEYSASPCVFSERFIDSEKALMMKISNAETQSVSIPEDLIEMIPLICGAMNVHGHRGDIAVMETSLALAALDGMREVTVDHLRRAVYMCLCHRSTAPQDPEKNSGSMTPLFETPSDKQRLTDAEDKDIMTIGNDTGLHKDNHNMYASILASPAVDSPIEDVVFGIGEKFRVSDFLPRERDLGRDGESGRRGLVLSEDLTGHCVGISVPKGRPRDIALGATVRNAAPHQTTRHRDGVAIAIEETDIREKVRVRRKGKKILFVVDGSGSMGAESRMMAVKGAVMSILEEAYRHRDMVGLVVFRGERAETVLPMTRSVANARIALEEMPTGGRTPLVSGLQTGYRILKKYADGDDDPVMVVLTDGWGNVSIDLGMTTDEEIGLTARAIRTAGIVSVVVDTEPPGSKFRRAPKLADMLGARCIMLETMNADGLTRAVESSIDSRYIQSKERNTQ